MHRFSPHGLVVRIPTFHVGDLGSNPSGEVILSRGHFVKGSTGEGHFVKGSSGEVILSFVLRPLVGNMVPSSNEASSLLPAH